MEVNKLLDKPCSIFNMDETGMPLDPKPPKVVTWRGHKNPSQVSSGVKSQNTVVGCVSAGGQCLPPMVIWDRKNLPPELAVGEVPGTIYGLSSKGWIDQELFNLWFSKHFLRYAPPVRPLLLLMDGHSSHFCPATIRCPPEEQGHCIFSPTQHHTFDTTIRQGSLWTTKGCLETSLPPVPCQTSWCAGE